jgi:hypothetical protein
MICLDMYGLHNDNLVAVYLNATAHDALQTSASYPPGSVVVKEHDPLYPEPDEEMIAFLGVMSKREPGFDPLGGDWEYLVYISNQAVPVDRGPIEKCRSCHSKVSDTDYVFLPYLR